MENIRVMAGPAVEPVPLHEAKAHLRVDTDEEDVLIAAMVRAARLRCEQYSHRAFITQTIRYTVDLLPEVEGNWLTSEASAWATLELPRPPFQALVAVTYATEDQEGIPLDPTTYRVSLGGDEPARLMLRGPFAVSAPREYDALTVDFEAGYGPSHVDVPDPIRQAILVTTATMYEDREGIAVSPGTPSGDAPLPPLARALLAGYKLVLL